MSYDLNILCVNQKKRIKELPVNIHMNPRNKNKDAYPKYYDRYFHFMNSISGIWYYLKEEEENWSSFELCDICEIDDELYSERYPSKLKELYPFWCDDSVDELDIDFFCLREKHKEDVLKTMQILIERSPIRHIVFLAKYQIVDNSEFIYGTISYEKFVELLESRKILFNTCYVIKG